jgi:hypothetical protein
MSRWEVIEPYAWPGAWEGRVRITQGDASQTELCGHLHKSRAEAEQCAQGLAAWLNSKLMPSDC